MSVDVGAGFEADAGPVDLGAQLAFHIGSLADSERRRQDREDRRAREIPEDNPLGAVGTYPTTGPLLLDLGAVPVGMVWQVRRIIVGGALVTASPAGTAYVYGGGNPPTGLSIVNCVDILLTLPRGSTYGTHELYLLPNEHLWVAISGGTTGVQYVANARAEGWSEAAYFAVHEA